MAMKSSNKTPKAATGGGSPSEISPAAELIASNVDLLTEILLRLPAKSLIRFKSVSRDWLSLISHSQFSTTHSSRNPGPSISGLYFYKRSRLESVSLHGHKNLPSLSFLDDLEGNGPKPRILNSCNGLLLCETGFKYEPIYIVCNVTTQKYKLVPKPSGLSYRRALHRSSHLAFDPSKSPHYKVVVGSHYNHSKSEPWSFEIDMYDSEGGNWRKILPPHSCWGRGVFWNGAIHWLSKTHANVLLRLDVDAEEVITLPLPPSPSILLANRNIKYFGECGGGLILVQTSSTSAFAILELESDTSSRIVKYGVDRRTIARAFPEMEEFFEFYVLCVVKGEKDGDYALVLAIPGKVISYNLKCNTLDVLLDLEPRELIDDGVNGNGCAYPFLETLSPI